LQQLPSAQPGHGQQEQQPSFDKLAALLEAIGETENSAAAKRDISFNIDSSFELVIRIRTNRRREVGRINS